MPHRDCELRHPEPHSPSGNVSQRLSELLRYPPHSVVRLSRPSSERSRNESSDGSSGGEADCRRVSPQFDESGLIIPRKAIHPVMESRERKELQRELVFNQKVGKNVLDTKCELTKALEKRKDNAKRKQEEMERSARRNSFEIRMEQLAERMKEFEVDGDKVHEHVIEQRQRHGSGMSPSPNEMGASGDSSLSPAHSPTRAGDPSMAEFLKVRAKITSNHAHNQHGIHSSNIPGSSETNTSPNRTKCDCLIVGSSPKAPPFRSTVT